MRVKEIEFDATLVARCHEEEDGEEGVGGGVLPCHASIQKSSSSLFF